MARLALDLPHRAGVQLAGQRPAGIAHAGFDKIVHLGMFAGWTVLWLLVYPRKSTLILLLGVAFGIFLEFYQQWLPFDRTFDWWDAAADGLGALLGLVVFFLYPKKP